ncbi:hypothetical protein DPMN_148748 [Dreissena polymorpha]|uniref:Uncharacterized protein n=1 Tax=Dreissena polymorpha TaxID=45954 RepID=A0A9D4J1U4_DREPO|nr:hypothetical protein DPMN_148748 [Dreissena polymorpha]
MAAPRTCRPRSAEVAGTPGHVGSGRCNRSQTRNSDPRGIAQGDLSGSIAG